MVGILTLCGPCRFDSMSTAAQPSSSVLWLGVGSFFGEELLGEVSLKRLGRSVMKDEDTELYGGDVSGTRIMNEELALSHLALAREPDCVCHVSIG